jgi:predicted lipid-binding transport protein (Tim44 family)
MEIIIFALISVFILFKLYSILGKNDNSDDFIYKFSEKLNDISIAKPIVKDIKEVAVDNLIDPPKLLHNPKISNVLATIGSYDMNFNEEMFLKGAKKAFELIIKAFCNGDKEFLKPLVNENIYKEFIYDINNREVNNRFTDKTLVSIKSAEIFDALLQKTIAEIKVSFISEQINIVRNREKEIIEGNPSKVQVVEDIWTFARDVNSRSPNWQLINTSS